MVILSRNITRRERDKEPHISVISQVNTLVKIPVFQLMIFSLGKNSSIITYEIEIVLLF